MFLNNFLKSKFWPAAWLFFSRMFIFLGLPLLAWGAGDLSGFLSHPVRASFALAVTLQTLILAWLAAISPPEPEHEHRFDLPNWPMSLAELIFIIAAFGDRRDILTWGENLPLRWLGLAIYGVGLALSIWNNLTWTQHLRREGDHACANPVLLTEGLFKWIRYPFLLSLVFYGLGFTLLFRSWIGLAVMLGLLGGIVDRVQILERFFAEQFPQAWPARRRKSWRIIPFVY